MAFHPENHHRRSVRLPGHDYAGAGWYFVTICALRRGDVFGRIVRGEFQANRFGAIVIEEWRRVSHLRDEMDLDQWILMPDHLHAIIHLTSTAVERDLGRDSIGRDFGRTPCAPTFESLPVGAHGVRPIVRPIEIDGTRRPRSVSSLVAGFKSAATSRINILRGQPTQVWQRNYWEHIIRDEHDLEIKRRYILENPMRWQTKRDYPV